MQWPKRAEGATKSSSDRLRTFSDSKKNSDNRRFMRETRSYDASEGEEGEEGVGYRAASEVEGLGQGQAWLGGEISAAVSGREQHKDDREPSDGSQTEGTDDEEEEEEEEAELDGEGDDRDGDEEMQTPDPVPSYVQMGGRVRKREEPSADGVGEKFQRPSTDEERALDTSESAGNNFDIYLSPPKAGSTALTYSTSLSGVPVGVEAASGNGGLSASYAGDGMLRETGLKGPSFLERPGSNARREQQQPQASTQDNVRGLSTEGDSDNYYTSLLTSSGASISQKGKDTRDIREVSNLLKSPFVLELQTTEPSLRHVLSDPTTGQLMEDATIFSCGHTFGCAGLQQVLRTNSCLLCGASVCTEAMAPNYTLRAAVEAFKREAELQKLSMGRLGKKRKEMHEEDQPTQGEPSPSEGLKAKGVQFPFVVSDRVLIKGNKRTPGRFVGREAIITTQCLNGWYLVRTLDNGESVRLQYRSLQKVGGFCGMSVAVEDDVFTPHSDVKSWALRTVGQGGEGKTMEEFQAAKFGQRNLTQNGIVLQVPAAIPLLLVKVRDNMPSLSLLDTSLLRL